MTLILLVQGVLVCVRVMIELKFDETTNNLVVVKSLHTMVWRPRFIEFEFCAEGTASHNLRFTSLFVDHVCTLRGKRQ